MLIGLGINGIQASDDTMAEYPRKSRNLDYHKNSITDDVIATAMHPSPATMSDLISHLTNLINKKEIQPTEIKSLDLSENNITNEASVQLFNYITQHFPAIEKLNLSSNFIRDDRKEEINQEFEENLKKLLELSTFKTLDLKANELE